MCIRRADDRLYTLLSSGAATGSAVTVLGGEYLFCADGTASGATVALQIQMPDGTWTGVNVFSGSTVQATALPYAQTSIDLPAGSVRCFISGGPPTGVSAYLVGLG